MIRCQNVSYTYAGAPTPAVDGLDMHLPAGSFHYLMGPSGAGKTTVFRMMYLDLLPTGGKLEAFGQNVNALGRDDIAHLRRRMGVVFQDFRLLPNLTVEENVSLPLTLSGRMNAKQRDCVHEILHWVGLGERLGTLPAALSGGEKQRVAIARAVVTRPDVLIADEPTGNVDPLMGRRIMHLFTELNRHGTTVLIATHDNDLVRDCPAPVLRLEGGTLKTTRAA